MLYLHIVDGMVNLFWVSLGLREDVKNIVSFPSGEWEHVDRMESLIWVSQVLWETGGPIPSVDVGVW